MKTLTKPILIGTAITIGLLGPIASSQAAEIGPYIGIGAAQSDDELLNETESAFKAFVGANITHNIGFELSYVDLGTFASGALSQEGIAYEVIGYLPLSHELDLYGRAGFFDWEVSDNSGAVVGTEPTFGIGANIRLNPHASLRGEWQTFLDVDGGDVDLYSASLSFNF